MSASNFIFKKMSAFLGAFFLQFIIFFPLSFLTDFQAKMTYFLFGKLTKFILESFFFDKKFRIDYSSDSASMLVLILILFPTSLIFTFIFKSKWTEKFLSIVESIGTLYLSLILIKYGIDKVLHLQFPIPETNILFTRLGNLDKDILFWSTIGTSKTYNTITGCIELIAGVLLLFKRSQFLGLSVAFICFCQIFIINISLDISVKFFSFILLMMSLFLMRKNGKDLFLKMIEIPKKTFLDQSNFLPLRAFVKIVILGFALTKIGTFYFNENILNKNEESSDFAKAYKVISPESCYQYLFFHKDQYLIFMEKSTEKMTVLHYEISFDNQLILEDDQLRSFKIPLEKDKKSQTISLLFNLQKIEAKAVDYLEMNALQDRFHLLVDY